MYYYKKEEIMYITFLDYDGNGNDKKARILICKWIDIKILSNDWLIYVDIYIYIYSSSEYENG